MAPAVSDDESQFKLLVERLGSAVANRFHPVSEKIADKYVVTETMLGAGSSGTVYLAHNASDSTNNLAVKIVKFESVCGFSEWKMLERQLEVALRVDHPHVIGVTDVYETEHCLHFVMPHMEGGQLIKDHDAPLVSDYDARDLTRQMLLALSYMHRQGIVHRDVKPANFVREKRDGGLLKLIDFDMSAFWKQGNPKMSHCCGTPGYMAPELLSQTGYTNKVDMWSLGVTLYVLLVGKIPFPDDDEVPTQEAVDEVLNSKEIAAFPADTVHFLRKLLRTDPAARLGADEALRHPFITRRQQTPGIQDIVKREAVSGNRANNHCIQALARRQRRTPQRRGQVRNSIRRTSCLSCYTIEPIEHRISSNELAQALRAFEEEYCMALQPNAPSLQVSKPRWADLGDVPDDDLQTQAPKVRWADLEDSDEE
jgi:calcium/calmodulin-dependent protein kinase I